MENEIIDKKEIEEYNDIIEQPPAQFPINEVAIDEKPKKDQTALWIEKTTRDKFKAQRKEAKMKTDAYLNFLLDEIKKIEKPQYQEAKVKQE
jgi:hypothetical protein